MWNDYYFEIRNYFEGWLIKLKINTISVKSVKGTFSRSVEKEVLPRLYTIWEDLMELSIDAKTFDIYDRIRVKPTPYKVHNSNSPYELTKKDFSRSNDQGNKYQYHEKAQAQYCQNCRSDKTEFVSTSQRDITTLKIDLLSLAMGVWYGRSQKGKVYYLLPSNTANSAEFAKLQFKMTSLTHLISLS